LSKSAKSITQNLFKLK